MSPSLPLSANLLALLLFSGLPPATGGEAPKPSEKAKPYAVETIRDLAYFEGEGADPVRHKLDLYLPKDCKDFPVLFFVHGGSWVHGDKNQFGAGSVLGGFYAQHGIGVVAINYRLSPGVKHPEHIKDVARAFAWTHEHIAHYGGRPDAIFVAGHSAGGHLVALLGTDDTYLKAYKLSTRDIRGVIGISGVYEISGRMATSAFGTDPDTRKAASPIAHVREGLPPFLLLYGDSDFPNLDIMAQAFAKALKEKKVPAEQREMNKQNHFSILFSACIEDNPCSIAIRDFIAAQLKP